MDPDCKKVRIGVWRKDNITHNVEDVDSSKHWLVSSIVHLEHHIQAQIMNIEI